MFRLRDSKTGLWYKSLDEDADIIWTEYKDKALVFPPDKRQWWEEEYGDEFEITELEVDEVMAQVGAPRLPGF